MQAPLPTSLRPSDGRIVNRFLHLDPIFLGGIRRTGSPWIASILSQARNVRYFCEPLTHSVDQRPQSTAFLNHFLELNDSDPDYFEVWRDLLSARTLIKNRWFMGRTKSLARYSPTPARLLIKEVTCSLALEWLQKHLGARIAVMLRHPCGVVASGLRMHKAGHQINDLGDLLGNERFMRQHFSADREWLESLDEPISQLAACYGMNYKFLSIQLSRHPEWVVASHEEACRDPIDYFRRLFQALKLPYSRGVEKFIAQSTKESDAELFSTKRRSSEEPDKWKRELTSAQIDTIAQVIYRFQLPFYREFA